MRQLRGTFACDDDRHLRVRGAHHSPHRRCHHHVRLAQHHQPEVACAASGPRRRHTGRLWCRCNPLKSRCLLGCNSPCQQRSAARPEQPLAAGCALGLRLAGRGGGSLSCGCATTTGTWGRKDSVIVTDIWQSWPWSQRAFAFTVHSSALPGARSARHMPRLPKSRRMSQIDRPERSALNASAKSCYQHMALILHTSCLVQRAASCGFVIQTRENVEQNRLKPVRMPYKACEDVRSQEVHVARAGGALKSKATSSSSSPSAMSSASYDVHSISSRSRPFFMTMGAARARCLSNRVSVFQVSG